eukprot:TRINITY_DN21371_c0_g1_i1.p1 TRINITY_DN21371_c0_g1~~TRINITY_DN21371_c0_g1_i1.p1  ORF type:complete len:324 (+),score=80.77 TRINITY_DN21371_c0_g1_i1:43-972(+)
MAVWLALAAVAGAEVRLLPQNVRLSFHAPQFPAREVAAWRSCSSAAEPPLHSSRCTPVLSVSAAGGVPRPGGCDSFVYAADSQARCEASRQAWDGVSEALKCVATAIGQSAIGRAAGAAAFLCGNVTVSGAVVEPEHVRVRALPRQNMTIPVCGSGPDCTACPQCCQSWVASPATCAACVRALCRSGAAQRVPAARDGGAGGGGGTRTTCTCGGGASCSCNCGGGGSGRGEGSQVAQCGCQGPQRTLPVCKCACHGGASTMAAVRLQGQGRSYVATMVGASAVAAALAAVTLRPAPRVMAPPPSAYGAI